MIIFSEVTKRFGDQSPALDGVSFEIDPGELVAITGPSGSGKTTLMRLLTKEYLPTSGEIVFNQTPLQSIGRSKIHRHRRNIGVVFQDYKLLPELNVWENIALALSIIGAPNGEIETRVTDLLKLVDLVDKAFLFPNQLSGGEAQRVSIARALSTAPKVIFADEPTGNLDPQTGASIVTLLQKINNLGTTIMVTTHDPMVLEMLSKNRHMILEQGKIVKDSQSKKSSPSPKKKEAVEEKTTPEAEQKKPPKQKEDAPKTKKSETPESSTTDESNHAPASKKRVTLTLPGFLTPWKKAAEQPSPPEETKKEAATRSDSDRDDAETSDEKMEAVKIEVEVIGPSHQKHSKSESKSKKTGDDADSSQK